MIVQHQCLLEVITRSSAILNAGYKVSTSHCGPGTVKTNAPSHVVWDVFRTWVSYHDLCDLYCLLIM